MSDGSPMLEVSGLKKWFRLRGRTPMSSPLMVRAVDDVSFDIRRGEVLGLVGESGSGKTTVGRSVLRLVEITGGAVRFDGAEVLTLRGAALKEFRRRAQIVFQDPFSSLNPRMTVERTVAEPLFVQGILPGRRRRADRVAELLEKVGLSPDHMRRYPHEFSGGQRQRIAIARALVVKPEFLVADEPVSALDVSVQAQIVNLLRSLKRQLGLTMLFIAHDLAVVEYIADRIAVMYLGKVMEIAPAKGFAQHARHPYSRALLAAVPIPDPAVKREKQVLEGDIPSPINPPSGCVFRTRCSYAVADCAKAVPPLREVGPGHSHACIRDPAIAAAR